MFDEHAARLTLPSLAWGLVEDGRVVAHAPEIVGLRGPWAGCPDITVRQLMTMSSGLATDDAWADRHLDLTDDELDRLVGEGLCFAAMPGTEFHYSNLGYALLGRVVRNVTGSTVQRLVDARVLGPLGLTRTTWTAPAGAVTGHRSRHDATAALVAEPALGDGVMAPMGGLFSCVRDVASWTGFLSNALGSEPTVDDAVLSAASCREMQQVWRSYGPARSVSTGGWTTSQGGYGYGLNVLPHAKLGTVVAHSGGLPGFGSNMRWVQGTGVGLVALSNTTYAPMAAVTSDVLDRLADEGAVSARRPEANDDTVSAARRSSPCSRRGTIVRRVSCSRTTSCRPAVDRTERVCNEARGRSRPALARPGGRRVGDVSGRDRARSRRRAPRRPADDSDPPAAHPALRRDRRRLTASRGPSHTVDIAALRFDNLFLAGAAEEEDRHVEERG